MFAQLMTTDCVVKQNLCLRCCPRHRLLTGISLCANQKLNSLRCDEKRKRCVKRNVYCKHCFHFTVGRSGSCRPFLFLNSVSRLPGLPWWLGGKESTWKCRDVGFNPWVRKVPQRKKWQPTLVFLPEESHGQRYLVGYSPWGAEELDTT